MRLVPDPGSERFRDGGILGDVPHPTQCVKCGSRDVIADAKVIDNADYSQQRDLSVATFRAPTAWIFKGQQTSTVSAWVCGSCGFIELYADAPESLGGGSGGAP